jgi:hypothetical protein
MALTNKYREFPPLSEYERPGIYHDTDGEGYPYGWMIAGEGVPQVQFGSLFGSIGHFISNCVHSVGREIGKATHAIVQAGKVVEGAIAKIPVIGSPVTSVFDATFHLATAPMAMAYQVAIEGKRVDKALVRQLQQTGKDFKEVAPYAQMVVGLVPGVGTGVSAAMGAGLALAEGQPIDKILTSAVAGALPGGPLAKAALTMAHEGVMAAVEHKAFDIATMAKTAVGAAAVQLGLPAASTSMLLAGTNMAGQLAHGAPVDTALSQGVIAGLPVDSKVKAALTEASAISVSLVHGAKIDKTLLGHVDSIAQYLPVPAATQAQLRSAAQTGKSLAQGLDPAKALSSALQTGVADSLLSLGSAKLPSDVRKAMQSGMALGSAALQQVRRGQQLVGVIPGKLTESGIQWAKTMPAVTEARKLVGQGTKGFDMAAGLGSHASSMFDLLHLRNSLNGVDRMGFDMAMSLRVGLVCHPPVPKLTPAAHAGFALAFGMQGHAEESKVLIMKAIQVSPSASVGASEAVKVVAVERESWLYRIFRALGLVK